MSVLKIPAAILLSDCTTEICCAFSLRANHETSLSDKHQNLTLNLFNLSFVSQLSYDLWTEPT